MERSSEACFEYKFFVRTLLHGCDSKECNDHT